MILTSNKIVVNNKHDAMSERFLILVCDKISLAIITAYVQTG
jgi:hypothetical protein